MSAAKNPNPEAGEPESMPVTVIKPAKGWMAVDFGELWRYRELFGFFVWRDVKVKYKQTLLGFSWAIIAPLANTIIFTFLFSRVARLPSDGLPPMVFYMTGLVIWRYFQLSFSTCSISLVGNQALLTKIYVPRLSIPISTLITNLVDFTIAFAILLGIMAFFQVLPAATILLLPLLLLIAMGTALGVGLFFAALNVRYRDVKQLAPFIVQMWMWCTVIIPFSKMPERFGIWKYLYGLNPMGGVVEGFRWCLLHPHMENLKTTYTTIPFEQVPQILAEGLEVTGEFNGSRTVWQIVESTPAPVEAPWMLIAIGIPVMLALLAGGLYYFRRVERTFADII